MHPCEVVVLGDYFLDIIITGLKELPRLGADIFGDNLEMTPGGAYIISVALHRLGVHTEWVAHLGNDLLSEFVLREARHEGLCEELFKRYDFPLRKLSVSFSFPHDRGFISYIDPVETQFPIDDIARRSPAWLVNPPLGGEPLVHNFLREVRRLGAKIYLDSQFVNFTLESPGISTTLGLTDVFTCNQSEAACLTGLTDPQKAVEKLAQFCPLVVLKCGGDGAFAQSGTTQYFSPALHVDVVDTTGAGDSFNAGFLSAYIQRNPIEICLKYGNISGGLSTTRCGGASAAPTQAQLQAWLNQV